MFNSQGSRGTREYYWFAVLLIVVLATMAAGTASLDPIAAHLDSAAR